MFEKHGGDPMKRSLKNQLLAQMGYSMIINNTICTPLLTLRIYFGPLRWFSVTRFDYKGA